MIGWQEPVIECLPRNIVGTYADQAITLAGMAGLNLDPWQQYLLRYTLAHTGEPTYCEDGTLWNTKRWSARNVGVMISRQNGKGSYLEALELAALFLLREEVIFHTAHEF